MSHLAPNAPGVPELGTPVSNTQVKCNRCPQIRDTCYTFTSEGHPEASGRPGEFEGVKPLQSDEAPMAPCYTKKAGLEACFFVEHRRIELLTF